MLKVQPVRRGRRPGYPTKDFLQAHPELLSAIPARWRNHRVVLAALGGTISLALAAEGGRIAPLFAHGNGQGAYGCRAVNPPVFLTEEEGRAIVREEGRRVGLVFEDDGLVEERAAVPVTNTQDHLKIMPGFAKEMRIPERQTQRLVFDGYDAKHRVAYELVSFEDFGAWEWKGPGPASTVSVYDVKDVAERLQASLAEQRSQLGQKDNGAWVGVFYTPTSDPGKVAPPRNSDWKDWENRRAAAARPVSEKELRKQVRDFIGWLKAQGVI